MTTITRARLFWLGLVELLMCVLPAILSPAVLPEATRLALLIGTAMTLNLLVGATGLISMGQGLLFGFGAYVVAIGTIKLGLPYWEGALIALASSLPVGLVVALIALRTRHLFFGLLTMAIGQVAFVMVSRSYTFTGGDEGLVGVAVPDWLESDSAKHYVAVAALMAVALVLLRVQASPFGVMLGAVRDNADRVASMGANPKRFEIAVMVIAGFLAAFLGVVWSCTEGMVDPTLLSWVTSTMLVMMVALGGRSMFLGPVLGAVMLEVSRAFVQAHSEHSDLVVGVLVILCAILFPEGIGPKLSDFWKLRGAHSSERDAVALTASMADRP
jgi:branched-chain amino acid transport system permease protein